MGLFRSSSAKGQAAEVRAAYKHRIATQNGNGLDTPEALLAEAHADALADEFVTQHGHTYHRY